jgi:hypothetical protein
MVLSHAVLAGAVALAAATPAAAAGAPADTTLARLVSLRLDRARIHDPAHPLVLHAPRFDAAGIAWKSVDGFPHSRPALISGADWDSVPPPPNPIPWATVAQVEAPEKTGIGLAGFLGGAAGFVVGYGGTQLVTAESSWSSSQVTATSIAFGVVGAIAGGWIAHELFGPEQHWRTVYAAPATP